MKQEQCCCFVNVTIPSNNKLYNVECKVKELMVNVWHSFVFFIITFKQNSQMYFPFVFL
jgi:hypothetical protein